ncbi:MAG: hypothetical protein Q9228_005821, partial [Teloschistes exilis]
TQTVDSQLNLVALAESAAHTFYWKYDESVANKCKILAGLKKAAIQASFLFLGLLVPATAPAAAGIIPEVEAAVANSSSFLAMKGTRLAQFALSFTSAFPTNKDIGHFYDIYREVVESTNSDIIKGSSSENFNLLGYSTTLVQVIRSGEYLVFTDEQDKRFVREPNLIEQDLTQHYKNDLISTVLKGQMCYIECSSKSSSQSDITRFEPEEGNFCAAKCWQNWASEKTLKVYGLDEIAKPDNDWGIQVQAFLKASYDQYKKSGFRTGPMLPPTETLFDNEVKTTSGSYLPVCDSYISHHNSHLSGIPCMCGDEYGSETARFWEAANFASWKAVQVNGESETKKGPPYLCKNDMSMERTPPVAYFLNLCNTDWRWPTLMNGA